MENSHAFSASRRDLLKALAAAGAGAILPAAGLIAQSQKGARNNPGRIDVHHQYSFVADGAYGTGPTKGQPEMSLEQMDKHGIATAILSTAGYGDQVYDGSEKARTLARKSNEYAAKLVDLHPKRFGFMAILPIPDQDAALREIEFALPEIQRRRRGNPEQYRR